jgi:hypothetical protein
MDAEFNFLDTWCTGVYFVAVDHPKSLFYFETSTTSLKDVMEAGNDFGQGLSISADGRWLFYSMNEESETSITFVDRFD